MSQYLSLAKYRTSMFTSTKPMSAAQPREADLDPREVRAKGVVLGRLNSWKT